MLFGEKNILGKKEAGLHLGCHFIDTSIIPQTEYEQNNTCAVINLLLTDAKSSLYCSFPSSNSKDKLINLAIIYLF